MLYYILDFMSNSYLLMLVNNIRNNIVFYCFFFNIFAKKVMHVYNFLLDFTELSTSSTGNSKCEIDCDRDPARNSKNT